MEDTTPPRVELARAKVNLSLHVTGQRDDGYHLLESLVVFPQIGDRIAIEPATSLELNVDGPQASTLPEDPSDNLVLRAVYAFAAAAEIPPPRVRIKLTKRIPVAAGIGGGSSDAATCLRLLEDYTGLYLNQDVMDRLALSLGADVPVCLRTEPQIMGGIGEILSDAPELPRCAMVLVNPRVQVSTPEIFRALTRRDSPPLPPMPKRFPDLPYLAAFLQECRNDLQAPAEQLCGSITEVLAALKSDNRTAFSRMSGSGATCFALCERRDALDLEHELKTLHPSWWVASGPLG